MATIDPTTNSIIATVGLEIRTDTMGQLVSDASRGYVWITDESSGIDVVQNLNLAVSDPASQLYVTAVGGTSFGQKFRHPRAATRRVGVERPALFRGKGGRGRHLRYVSRCRRTNNRWG